MKTEGTSVLILQEKNPEKTFKGIIIPRTAQLLKSTGKVVDCGEGCKTVQKGDRVIYSPKTGSIIPIEGVEHHYVSERDIQYIYGQDTKG